MSLTNFQHVQIPFDELNLFHQPEKNQIFLIETLLFSTKITLHVGKHKYSSILIITKHHVWFKDERKKKNIFALPVSQLLGVIKAQHDPQIVFVTEGNFDNVRISVSSQQRCNHIISGLSYLFTRIHKTHPPLRIYFSKQSNLKLLQKTWQQKKQQNFIAQLQQKYPWKQIVYKEAGKQEIYGSLNLENKRISLLKQIYHSPNHMIHVAKLVSSHQKNSQQNDDNKDECQNEMKNYFYLHTIEKSEEIIESLKGFQPLPYDNLGEELVYVRQLDYKVQVFFRYLSQVPKEGSPYYNYQLTPQRLFVNLIQFYDIMLLESPETVLTYSLLCFEKLNHKKIISSNNKANKRSFRLTEQYNDSFSQITLKLRQFRYDFLMTENKDLMKLIYHCYYENGEFVYDPTSWKTKFYNLSLILYEFLYGKEYFSTQLDPETILKMKKSRKVYFPKYLNTQASFLMSWELQDFMERSIKLKFKSLEDVYNHPWMKENVLILAYEHSVRKSNKDKDIKTDATKSF